MRSISAAAFVFFALAALTACDDVRSPTFIPELERIEVCRAPTGGCSATACTGPGSTTNAIIPVGREVQFCAVGFYERLINNDVTIPAPPPEDLTNSVIWNSGNPSSLSITQGGRVQGLAEAASVEISASAGNVDPGTAQVRVTAAVLEALEIDPPLVARTVPGRVTQFSCTGRYTGDPTTNPACLQVDPLSCDETDDVEWSAANPNIFRINNTTHKGLGTAVSAGPRTSVRCDPADGDPSIDTSQAEAQITVCDDAVLNTLIIKNPGTPNIISGDTRDLALEGNFTADCGSGNQTFNLDLTLSADWQSDRPDVVSIDNDISDGDKGIATARDMPGLATISASFGGRTATIALSTIDGDIVRVDVTGPTVVFPGFGIQLTATPFFRDAETNELVEGEDATMSADTIWRSLEPDSLNFPDNDGFAVAAPEANPQVVAVTATFRGVESLPFGIRIVDAELTDVQVNPGLGCLSTLDLMFGSAAQRQYEASGIFNVELPGEDPVMCAMPVTERAEWRAADPEALSQSGSDLLSLLQVIPGLDAFVGGCNPLLPVAVSAGLTDSPAIVSNAPGSKGLVTANPDALLPMLGATVGTSCIQASIGEFTGQGTALVATDIVPDVCGGLEVLTTPLLADGTEAPSCEEAFTPDEGEDEGGGEGEQGGGLLGGLLGSGS